MLASAVPVDGAHVEPAGVGPVDDGHVGARHARVPGDDDHRDQVVVQVEHGPLRHAARRARAALGRLGASRAPRRLGRRHLA